MFFTIFQTMPTILFFRSPFPVCFTLYLFFFLVNTLLPASFLPLPPSPLLPSPTLFSPLHFFFSTSSLPPWFDIIGNCSKSQCGFLNQFIILIIYSTPWVYKHSLEYILTPIHLPYLFTNYTIYIPTYLPTIPTYLPTFLPTYLPNYLF